jgi:hypothetical protein
MKSSGTEYRTRIRIHTAMPTLFLTKVPKTYDGEKTDSSTNIAGKSGYLSACKRLKLDPCLSPCTCITSKWIKDVNIRPETL